MCQQFLVKFFKSNKCSIPVVPTKMSRKGIVFTSCAIFVVFTSVVLVFSFDPFAILGNLFNNQSSSSTPSITVFPEYGGDKQQVAKCTSRLSKVPGLKSPSLETFARSTATVEYPEFRLNAFAVYSPLKNACHPLSDVNKVVMRVHKIALVTLVDETACSLQHLAISAQKSGYSMLVYFGDNEENTESTAVSKERILIPVLVSKGFWSCLTPQITNGNNFFEDNDLLLAADRADVLIRVYLSPRVLPLYELNKMASYLRNLHYWLFVGPIITLVWLTFTKRSAWVYERQLKVENDHSEVGLDVETLEQGDTKRSKLRINLHGDSERKPLLANSNNVVARRPLGIRCVRMLGQIPYRSVSGLCYLVFLVASLPVGISLGGLSFFRFDQGDPGFTPNNGGDSNIEYYYISSWFVPCPTDGVWWPSFQILVFCIYSAVVCEKSWTVRTNALKLIRSDWFSSNIYLLVLGIVVPYCSFPLGYSEGQKQFLYFATYNTACTISNVLFIIILNKHRYVTRYVLYVSICMICAYIESDIVALFYFALNSQGSLNNLKLTAVRSVAIGFTLTISFISSMHIIRKLARPRESVFENLSEK